MDIFPFKYTLLALLVSASAYPQPLVIHNAPQGVATYPDSTSWPAISGQCHWVPGDGTPTTQPPDTLVPDMAHTHADFANGFPVWAELGNQTITIPITIQLFHTAGRVIMVTGNYGSTVDYAVYTPTVMDTPGPWVGDPNGLVKYNGHITINLAQAIANGVNPEEIPKHGWGTIVLFARTAYDNGDLMDNETVVPVYSMVDTTAPEAQLGEGGISLGSKCTDVVAHDANESNIFGIQLTAFRDQSLPLLAPFSAPLVTKAFGYNYSFDAGGSGGPGLKQTVPTFIDGTYQLFVDNDFHMGVAGALNVPPTVVTQSIGNFDTLDPLWISQQTQPMGFGPNKHRLTFQWIVNTGANGFVDQYGNQEPPNKELRSLLSVNVTIGPNPAGCNPTLCPPIPATPPPVPIVSNPPPPPVTCAPQAVPNGTCGTPPPTPSTVWITVATPNRHDVQQLMTDPTTPVVPLQFRVCQAGDANCSSSEIDK